MNMEKIRFIYLEDVKPEFEVYSALIKQIFEENGIQATQIFPTYDETHNFMVLYQDYLGRKIKSTEEKINLDNMILKYNLKSDDLIYFIDDNWENKTDNHDGTNCFRDILYTKNPDNSGNAIVLTGYTRLEKFEGMKYLRKNEADKNNLSQEIKDTSAYRKYIDTPRNKNKKVSNEKDLRLKGKNTNNENGPDYEKIN